jgi:hypothetical protein
VAKRPAGKSTGAKTDNSSRKPAQAGFRASFPRVPKDPKVGVLIGNAFVRLAVTAAIQEQNAQLIAIDSAQQAVDGKMQAVIVDLQAVTGEPQAFVLTLLQAGITVLGFGENLPTNAAASLRSQGVILLSRKSLLVRLPDLLRLALDHDHVEPKLRI